MRQSKAYIKQTGSSVFILLNKVFALDMTDSNRFRCTLPHDYLQILKFKSQARQPPPSPPYTPFHGAKIFFPRKIGKHKIFTCE